MINKLFLFYFILYLSLNYSLKKVLGLFAKNIRENMITMISIGS